MAQGHLCPVLIEIDLKHGTLRYVRGCQVWCQRERCVRRRTRAGVRFLREVAVEKLDAEAYPYPRHEAPGERITWIELRGCGELLDCLAKVGFGSACHVEPALQ